jgi:uncharacterized protein YqhQ
MRKKDKAKRYSGVSFGGIFQKVTIYGNKYTLEFGKNRGKSYGYSIKKNTRFMSLMSRFYLLFPLLDIGVVAGYFFSSYLDEMFKNTSLPSVDIGITIPEIYIQIFWYFFVFSQYVLLYFLFMRGVSKWHGTEHKFISALEDNESIDDVKKYNPIHERCGGTLMPTIIFASVMWYFIYSYTGILFGQMTFMTFCIFLNVRYFHKYDKIGLWVGKRIQKYFTIREPDEWQLELGKVAVKEFLLAEKGQDFNANKDVMQRFNNDK